MISVRLKQSFAVRRLELRFQAWFLEKVETQSHLDLELELRKLLVAPDLTTRSDRTLLGALLALLGTRSY